MVKSLKIQISSKYAWINGKVEGIKIKISKENASKNALSSITSQNITNHTWN